MHRPKGKEDQLAKLGFTIIEVMLFLAISGLILIGALGGTYSAIGNQRYNDAVQSYAEFLRQVYAEVISPESFGAGNSDSAIYGKVIFFGSNGNASDLNSTNRIRTATLLGSSQITSGADSGDFVGDLGKVNPTIFCENTDLGLDTSVEQYTPLWESRISNKDKIFTGTVIIARSPASGTIHTAYINYNFLTDSNDIDQKDGCNAISGELQKVIKGENVAITEKFSTAQDVGFCVKPDGGYVNRAVKLTADGRNTSAVEILDASSSEVICQ